MSVRTLPPAIRALNALGGAAARVGLARVDFEAEVLIAEARRETGLDDLGEPSFREPMEALLRSIRDEVDLHFLGARHLRELVVRSLVARLRLVEAARAGLDDTPLRPPLVVCGLPRSGTTFLHRLLAAADGARALPLWQLTDPLPGPGPDRRRADAARRTAQLSRVSGGALDAQHLVRPDLPDECAHLLKASFQSSMFWRIPAFGYLDAWRAADAGPMYRDWRRLLVLLQTDPSERYVLKDPFHAMSLPALFAAVPDAMVVQTHRAPSEVVPSFHKLTLTVHGVLCASVDTPRVVEANTAFIADVAARSVADRARVPDRIVDVDYRALLADPIGVVRGVHDRFDLGWSDALESKLRGFVADNGQRTHGENPYRAADYGQTAADIDARFEAYRARFLPEDR